MTPAQLARLHAECFETPRPWSEAEFNSLLAREGAILATVPGGFILGHQTGESAEVLTLAVAPADRRNSKGTSLVQAFEKKAAERGVREVFLEVAADNTAALTLYHSSGYVGAGRRRGYYRRPNGTRIDADVLSKALEGPDSPLTSVDRP